jgi:NAD(P)-dependent dehydrogenase (short-subunit alcohol dehydrogenase family)
VTGASQGIGRAIAESIAHHRRNGDGVQDQDVLVHGTYKLVLVGRNVQRGTSAASSIQKATGLQDVSFESCDLSDYRKVQTLREKIIAGDASMNARVGILVNCAAECPARQEWVERPRRCGKGQSVSSKMEQVDKQFATNVLGYHFMLKSFADLFDQETRIVNVASNWAGGLDLKDFSFRRRSYDNDAAYCQFKQCDHMLTSVWSDCLSATINSCHPGDPCTTLSRALGYNLWSPPPSRTMIESQGTIPFLCGFGTPSVAVTGKWFDGGKSQSPCRFAGMTREAQELHEICESFCVKRLFFS